MCYSLSHAQLFGTPWTTAHQAPLSMRFSRQRYWSGLSFPSPGDLPNPGIQPRSPAPQADSLPTELQGKPIQREFNFIPTRLSYKIAPPLPSTTHLFVLNRNMWSHPWASGFLIYCLSHCTFRFSVIIALQFLYTERIGTFFSFLLQVLYKFYKFLELNTNK